MRNLFGIAFTVAAMEIARAVAETQGFDQGFKGFVAGFCLAGLIWAKDKS